MPGATTVLDGRMIDIDGGVEQIQPDGGITARGVRRTFADVVAVDHMDLDVPAGAVTALIGPNGPGTR